ncbi:ribonuclease H-like domain-containing protein [Tanacetum coccineum]|uniref:Ribonuclease H-like domain-containing protein n=1 Tax=Tanacetum coccineum TaxID=301880 RepID=A0ABQ5HYR3_9ASTR
MRNKPDIDQTDIDDLYNNLGVYKDEMKRSSSSTSNSQNLAFLSSKNISSTNEVSTANGNFRVSTAGGTSSTSQVSSTLDADEVVCSFFTQQTTSPPLDNEDLQQIDQDDLEELDIRWQVAMMTVRVQRFIQKTRRNLDFKGKQPVTFDKSKVECYNCHRKGHFAKECKSGRNQGKRSYGDNGRRNATTNDIIHKHYSSVSSDNEGYELALESLESRILGHEKNELAWGEKYEFQNYELKSSDEKITPANDSFFKADGYHAAPPPITRNLLTPRADISFAGLNDMLLENKIIESKLILLNLKLFELDKVIIKDWKSDDEDDVSSVKTVSLVKTNETQTVRNRVDKIDKFPQKERNGFKKNKKWDNVRPSASSPQTRRSYNTKPALDPKDLKQEVKTSGFKNMTTAGTRAVVNTGKGKMDNDLKKSRWVWRPKGNYMDHGSKEKGSFILKSIQQDHTVVDSGFSSHMTGNKAYLSNNKDYNGGFVAFGSDPKGGKITGKGKIRTTNLDFDDVYFVDELKFNLFSVSQMCDKKISVLFTDTECLIMSPSFKLLDESQVVLRAPR